MAVEKNEDYRRASILCPSVAILVKVLEELWSTDGFHIVRVKNRFDRKFNSEETAGYRDLQLIIRVNGKPKLVWELQLHIETMHDVKKGQEGVKDPNGRTGHDRYKMLRKNTEQLGKMLLDAKLKATHSRLASEAKQDMARAEVEEAHKEIDRRESQAHFSLEELGRTTLGITRKGKGDTSNDLDWDKVW